MKKIIYLFLLLLVPFFILTSCGDNEDEITPSNPIVGSWIEDGADPSGYEVFHMDFTSNGKFEEYVTYNYTKSSKKYTGTWSYSSPTLKLKYSDGETYSLKVQNNKFTLGEITFKKQ